ncbi:MAG: ankyrin repeat domain-containing protein [Flavobacteriales bacterium]
MKLFKSFLIPLTLMIQPVFAQQFNNDSNVEYHSLYDNPLVTAIQNEDYNYVEKIIKNNQYLIDKRINGKTLIIHAATMNKPEMIRLLYDLGADINLRCEEGYSPEEHANFKKSFNALAEIIVIKA